MAHSGPRHLDVFGLHPSVYTADVASRGPKRITYIMGSPGFYEPLLHQFQNEEPSSWTPIEKPWEIQDASKDLTEEDSRAALHAVSDRK